VRAPEQFETRRLLLRRPRAADAEAIFARYASDRDVTRFLSWPRHVSIEQTREFLNLSDAEWARWPAGPYLVESREDGRLLGGTGFAFETRHRTATGYVFAKDVWGKGYATETVEGVVTIAGHLGLIRLYALCYVEHVPSWRVLEKCGFRREGILRRHSEFPNLKPGEPLDVFCYALISP
jgi:RimJ/RimL family protein N-acetyltransferase